MQIEDILVSDRQLAQELLYDMRSAEQQAAAELAAAGAAPGADAPSDAPSAAGMATPAAAAAVARAHLTRSRLHLPQDCTPGGRLKDGDYSCQKALCEFRTNGLELFPNPKHGVP